MRPLSAADAVSPAFARTRDLLFRDFRVGGFLKVALVASLAEIGCISIAVQTPLQVVMMFGSAAQKGQLPGAAQAVMLIFPILFVAFFALVWLVVSYLFTRLRFVIFDMVVGQRRSVSSSWSQYGPASWRYFGLNLLALLVLMIVVLAVAAPFLLGMLRAVQTRNPAAIAPHMLAIFIAAFAVSFLVQLVDSVLRDFFLPQMALENASIEEAAAGCMRLLEQSPGETILYLILKFVLAMAIGMALGVALILCVGLLGVGLGALGFLLYHFLWSAGVGGRATVITYGVLAGLGFLVIYVLGVIAASGINGVFRTAFAAYFFGPRYPPLGDLLEPEARVIAPAPIPEPQLPPILPSPPPVW